MFLQNETIDVILRSVILSSVALCWAIIVVRLVGLRAFSKMTAFDFVVTVAIGSVLAGASQATSWPGFFQPVLAIGVLLGTQYAIARLRRASDRFESLVQNSPVLLMQDGQIIREALEMTRVEEDDLVAKLREANVRDFSEIRAVVLETTGDISVLHGDSVQDRLLKGVRRVTTAG